MSRQLAIFGPAYPACVADGADCQQDECRLHLAAGAGASRCAAHAASICGAMEVSTIAGLLGVTHQCVGETLTIALRKVGPHLAALFVRRLPAPGLRVCARCGGLYRAAANRQELCSGACKVAARKRSNADHYLRRAS